MDVELPPLPSLDEARRLDAHEAGERDEVHPRLDERRVHGLVEGLARGIGLVVDGTVGNPCALAHASPAASGLLEMTTAISAG